MVDSTGAKGVNSRLQRAFGASINFIGTMRYGPMLSKICFSKSYFGQEWAGSLYFCPS